MNEKEAEEKLEEIYKLAYKYIGNKKIYNEDLEDMIQMIVFECWEKLIKYYDESKSKFSTFCYMAFRTSIRNYLIQKNSKKRRGNKDVLRFEDYDLDNKKNKSINKIADEYIDPLEKYEKEINYKKIIELIHQNDSRNILNMYYLEGKSGHQIAKKLSLTPQAVSSFIIRKTNLIKKTLNKGE